MTFKGVHYETIVTTKYRDYRIDTTDYFAVGLEVGLTFTPEDIHAVIYDILRHRIILSFEAQAEGVTSDDIIGRLLNLVPLP